MRFHQVGDDGDVGRRLLLALFNAAHTLSDFQADIPKQQQKGFDGVAVGFDIAPQQDQQVDVRVRVQLAATVAADRQQRDAGVASAGQTRPGLLQNLIGNPGTFVDQLMNVAALGKTLGQHGVSLTYGLFEGRDRAALESQFGLKLAGIEKRVIHHFSSSAGRCGRTANQLPVSGRSLRCAGSVPRSRRR